MEKTENDDKETQKTGDREPKGTDSLSTANPLNDFMSDWLSPDELARLDISDSSTVGAPGGSLIPVTMQLNLGEADRLLRSTESLSNAVSVPETRGPNPYLDLNDRSEPFGPLSDILAPPESKARSVPAIARPSPIQSRMGAGPANNAASSEEVKELWKPPVKEDEKYFRRLNRF